MFKNFRKKTALVLALGLGSMGALSACTPQAQTASDNLSKAADSFEINRRIVFFNGITDKYLLTIEGLCSINPDTASRKLDVTCKTGPNEYKKHFLGLSDNVSYFVEQLDGAKVDVFHYRVIFRPETIVPDINLQTSK